MPTPIGYDAVLVVVLIELIFAFGIGISCIIFSFNMYREVSLSGDKMDTLPVGELPSRLTFRGSNTSGISNSTTVASSTVNAAPIDNNSVSYLRDSDIMSNRTSNEELEDGVSVPLRGRDGNANDKFTYIDTIQHFLDYMRIW